MVSDNVVRGSLFSSDFVAETIARTAEWQAITDADLSALHTDLTRIFTAFPTAQTPNEAQTEDDLIWPVLSRLDWTASLRQQNLAAKGRDDVPDGLLFEDDAAKARANANPEEWKRYGFGHAIVESKRWLRPLDRQSGKRGEETAPSTQMLRYLRRVEDLTIGNLRWGILTDGAKWRLYFQGARSVSENFFELDLPAILAIPGHEGGLFALSKEDRDHWLRVFLLVFRRDAFIPGRIDKQTFHQRALADGKFYEERVAASVSDLVFRQVFPALTKSISAAAPEAPLQEVREAALILLYRLLFILYAEDRDLLPVKDARYDDYALRGKVRMDVKRRKDAGDVFSETAARYWSTVDDLCRAIDKGDRSIGIPPYNGGLFDAERTPLLARIRLGDAVMADVIDALSFEQVDGQRRYINFRDLSVQQLGSIYEKLLEHEVTREDGEIVVRPNVFARKGSGSYYTPDDLVGVIIRETIDPLITDRMTAFEAQVKIQAQNTKETLDLRLSFLWEHDPANLLLNLKICDPAMGSGHFLVSMVDYLADRIIAAIAEADALVTFGDYVSPVITRVQQIRTIISSNARQNGWTIDVAQLDDRHIIRRMILKRCIYGVDKNVMAVELAKVALWLHTFTVGAPLSFLDHHLRCGDSLFGSWVRGGTDRAAALGAPLFLHEPLTRATRAATSMQVIEGLTDAEIAEANRSADIFDEVRDMTAPLSALLSLIHALDWMMLKAKEDIIVLQAYLTGQYGDPVNIALGKISPLDKKYSGAKQAEAERFNAILERAKALIAEEKFLHWQVAFPGVWSNWNSAELEGGFDAIIGNPPWDRIKLQQVEWFAARRPAIALAQRASDRARMITALETAGDPLAADFGKANERAETGARMARECGDYPQLSGGDINLYSLFVERAMRLVKRGGIVGLLTPSGIASDKTAAPFFKSVATQGRLKALYDFENRRTRFNAPPFFPDVDSRFKFCAFVASPTPFKGAASCAFFIQDVSELLDPDRRFPLTPEDFARLNPNTGTAPIFRTRRDASLTTAIYGRLPVLVDRSSGAEVKQWPVKYSTMFHMANDSGLFRTRQELEEKEGAYPTGGNVFGSASGDWVPLYEGKMVQAFNHRAASVIINPKNLARPGQPDPSEIAQLKEPSFQPKPRYYVSESLMRWFGKYDWSIAFKDITSPTNMRSMIATLLPRQAAGHKLPYLYVEGVQGIDAGLLLANLNSIIFDYCSRQNLNTNSFTLFILEQLPVVPPDRYRESKFGPKTAAEIINAAVLELTYTAHDMAPFARDMGYVDAAENVKPPFPWDEDRRLHLRAKLDAVFFHLYGITDRDDVKYIYSTFPIVERQETEGHGTYRSRDLCLAYMNALAAGNPDAAIKG
jgi:hypothetical protein